MDNKIAEFRILTRSGEQMIENYYMPYTTPKELNNLIHEARQVWYEYRVEVETDLFVQTFSHSYSEEFSMENA